MGGGGEGGSNGGGEKELIETVLTCEGCISDPELPLKISCLIHHLQIITNCESSDWQVRKVEPWNSVRVTFSIPKEAANRLHQLAQAGDAALRQLGILSVQIEGDQIVSLKVAGPNNETAEIVLRTESIAGPSGESSNATSSLARSVTNALGGAAMLPGFSQTQHHQPHPMPQFRSPSMVNASDGIPMVVGRSPVIQQRPQGVQPPPPPPSAQQSFPYAGVSSPALHSRHIPPPQQQPTHPPPSPGVLVSGNVLSSSAVVGRPVFPTNPPPPYPNPEPRSAPTPAPPPPPPQTPSASQMTGQQPYAGSQTNSVLTQPLQGLHSHSPQQTQQLGSLPQSMAGSSNYRVSGGGGSQTSVANSGANVPSTPSSRGLVRTPVSMVKNSPLLVGLLQQPEQSVTGPSARNAKSGAANPSQTTPVSLANSAAAAAASVNSLSTSSSPLENGPLPNVISNAGASVPTTFGSTSGTYIGRSRDGFTTHQQIFSGGSVITNSVPPPPPPPPRHPSASGGSLHTQPPQQQQQHLHLSGQPSPSSPSARLSNVEDHRRNMAPGSASPASSSGVKVGYFPPASSVSSTAQQSPFGTAGGGGHGKEDNLKESKSVHFTTSVSKKESQYLINPNTGLLEPRPNSDSSDSEPEGRAESPTHDDQRSNSLASDDESNLSAASRKETDHSDSDVSRVSGASGESAAKKLVNCDRGNSQDRDSSPGSAWENNLVSSSPGEIKLRLKLGKEQVAQATIVGNANKKADRRGELTPSTVGVSSPNSGEPRVPKLHIKLHSSQPVIIKPVEETEASNRKPSPSDLVSTKEDKGKRKSGRSKPRSNCEFDFDWLKCKSLPKVKVNKDKTYENEVTSQMLRIFESKRNKHELEYEDNSFMRLKDSTSDSRVKVPRMLEVTKPSKVESKLRTRLKKTPIRKVGDLNSLGEIASHKILETLPPSITKVAAIHTQQPHRNPNASSPIPFSSIATSIFSSSSISASLSASSVTTTNVSSSACASPSSSATPSSGVTSGASSALTAGAAQSGNHLKAELEKRGSEIIPKTDLKVDVEKNGGDVVMTKLRVNNPALKNLMNGDVTHTEKMTINQMRFKRAGSLSSPSDFSSATSKLTIKRKNSEETHTLKALKKEGLGSVPTFLNSSVLINKVSPDKTSVSSISGTHRQNEDLSEKLLKKVENMKGPLRNEIAGLKSNSDITIHSVSKSDILGLSKGGGGASSSSSSGDFDRRSAADLTLKTKPEVTKVGRVTCVDVMDRKALEEALKSSRNSSKKNDIFKSTSSMVDRLRRWNSIDSSNSVPLSTTHSQPQASESTNLNSASLKTEPKETGVDSESEKPVVLPTAPEKVKTESGLSQQSNTIINVNNDKDCDNSGKDRFCSLLPDKVEKESVDERELTTTSEEKDAPAATKAATDLPKQMDMKGEPNFKLETVMTSTPSSMIATNTPVSAPTPTVTTAPTTTTTKSESGETEPSKTSRDPGKTPLESGNSSVLSLVVKSEVDSPEGTPKGEHGNGQGGEDSGIESMDALSEKSPNHSDQSPNRRDDKECELFQDKCKGKNIGPPGRSLSKSDEKDTVDKKPSPLSEESSSATLQETTRAMCKRELPLEEAKERFEKKLACSDNSQPTATPQPEATEHGSGTKSFETNQSVERDMIPLTLSSHLENQPTSLKGTSECSPAQSLSPKSTKEWGPDTVSSKETCVSQSLPVEKDGTSSNNDHPATSIPSNPIVSSPQPENQPEFLPIKCESTSEESSPSSQNKLTDVSSKTDPTPSCTSEKNSGAEYSSSSPSSMEPPVSTIVCSVALSITTTSLSVVSPKSSVVTSSSLPLYSPVTTPIVPSSGKSPHDGAVKDTSPPRSLLMSNSNKDSSPPVVSSFKPSLLAITLSRPPGASIMTSQYATSIANSIETTTTTSITTQSTSSSIVSTITPPTITTTAPTKVVSTLDSQTNSTSIVYCHSLACNNNSLAYCNSYTTATNTTATMIILASTTSNSSTSITTPNSTKVVTLKPGLNQSTNSALNPPVGKAFRLVALPGINSMTPAASPVKGQLVTLKPVVGSRVSPSIAKSSPLLQTVVSAKSDEQSHSILKNQLSSSIISSVETTSVPSAVLESISNEGHLDDLDFVGFSNIPEETELKETAASFEGNVEKQNSSKPPHLISPAEEEPTPMRVHPPLYTYGNRERKKEVEMDGEEKERESQQGTMSAETPPPSESPMTRPLESVTDTSDADVKEEDPLSFSKARVKLHALTIEIPNAESSFPDDKRLTRSTRQSARLASPKVNSPASGELSPRLDKRSPANAQTMGKPSPVGVLRSSVSPALRVTKRRRHESESSNASNVSEDQVEPAPKAPRRKVSENRAAAFDNAKEDVAAKGKGSAVKKETDQDKDRGCESSDEDCLIEDEVSKKRNLSTTSSSTNEDDEDSSRPSSRTGRPAKGGARSRDRAVAAGDAPPTSRDTTPTRRMPRQNRIGVSGTPATITVTTGLVLCPGSQSSTQDKMAQDSKESLKDQKDRPVGDLAKGEDSPKDSVLPKDGEKKGLEKKVVLTPLGKESPKNVLKVKKENEADADATGGRRKTRSTTITATASEDANKRRRLCKDK